MNIPVLALVENMSYFECPTCKEKLSIFGESKIEETAKNYDIDIVAKIPINPEFARLCDKGDIEKFNGEHLNAVLDKIFSL